MRSMSWIEEGIFEKYFAWLSHLFYVISIIRNPDNTDLLIYAHAYMQLHACTYAIRSVSLRSFKHTSARRILSHGPD